MKKLLVPIAYILILVGITLVFIDFTLVKSIITQSDFAFNYRFGLGHSSEITYDDLFDFARRALLNQASIHFYLILINALLLCTLGWVLLILARRLKM